MSPEDSNPHIQAFIARFQALTQSEQIEWGRSFRHATGGTLSAYASPNPVAIGLVPVSTQHGVALLRLRRAIEPQIGQIALPGGFVNSHEDPKAAVAREIQEEMGVTLSKETFGIAGEPVMGANNAMLVFYECKTPLSEQDVEVIRDLAGDGEASEIVLIDRNTPLAFPLHQEAAALFFKRNEPDPQDPLRAGPKR